MLVLLGCIAMIGGDHDLDDGVSKPPSKKKSRSGSARANLQIRKNKELKELTDGHGLTDMSTAFRDQEQFYRNERTIRRASAKAWGVLAKAGMVTRPHTVTRDSHDMDVLLNTSSAASSSSTSSSSSTDVYCGPHAPGNSHMSSSTVVHHDPHASAHSHISSRTVVGHDPHASDRSHMRSDLGPVLGERPPHMTETDWDEI